MEELRNAKGQTLAEFLAAYDVNKYPHPSVTSDTAVFTLQEVAGELCLSVALVRRGNHPDLGRYALPGGFLNMDETSLEGAARELEEETGVTGVALRRFGVFDALDRDPRTRVITIGHLGLAPMGSLQPKGGDDAAEAGLFTVDVALESWCRRRRIGSIYPESRWSSWPGPSCAMTRWAAIRQPCQKATWV